MLNNSNKSTQKWKEDLDSFLYYNKRARDDLITFLVCILGVLCHRMEMQMEYAILMFIINPIVFFIASIFINYIHHLKQEEELKNWEQEEDDWDYENPLPF